MDFSERTMHATLPLGGSGLSASADLPGEGELF